MVFYSGCYIRTVVNSLQEFLTKLLLNFVALPITAVVQPLLTGGNKRCKNTFVVECDNLLLRHCYSKNIILKASKNL
jgi:hypothetical protein